MQQPVNLREKRLEMKTTDTLMRMHLKVVASCTTRSTSHARTRTWVHFWHILCTNIITMTHAINSVWMCVCWCASMRVCTCVHILRASTCPWLCIYSESEMERNCTKSNNCSLAMDCSWSRYDHLTSHNSVRIIKLKKTYQKKNKRWPENEGYT